MAETLKAYPWPEGVEIPNLMPWQQYPWNNDHHLAAEVLRLKEAHGLTTAMETGTCLGSTTWWLCENFDEVVSTEINPQYGEIATERMRKGTSLANWCIAIAPQGDPYPLLAKLRQSVTDRSFCFLDAHWNENCPLLDELEAIAEAKVKPCILIHDFHVPGTTFGFDSMPDGTPFHLELVVPYMNNIYGVDGWVVNYPTKVEGAMRGWASFAPVSKG